LANNNIQQERINFATSKKVLEYPDFLDVQLESFKEFFSIRNYF